MFSTGFFVVVAFYVVLRFWTMRRMLLMGESISTPAFAAILVLGLGLLIGTVLRFSPIHLWWWFPLSFVIATALIFSQLGAKFIMTCLALLAWPFPLEKSEQKSINRS